MDTPLHNNTLVIKRPSLCIPVKPKVVKTDAENFIERLWAFLTIQNLLEESTRKEESSKDEYYWIPPETTTSSVDDLGKSNETLPEKEKTEKEKAIEIALKYNFVTDVTSLVVKKPNENSTTMENTGNDNKEEEVLDDENLLKSNSLYSTSYVNQNQVNY